MPQSLFHPLMLLALDKYNDYDAFNSIKLLPRRAPAIAIWPADVRAASDVHAIMYKLIGAQAETGVQNVGRRALERLRRQNEKKRADPEPSSKPNTTTTMAT